MLLNQAVGLSKQLKFTRGQIGVSGKALWVLKFQNRGSNTKERLLRLTPQGGVKERFLMNVGGKRMTSKHGEIRIY